MKALHAVAVFLVLGAALPAFSQVQRFSDLDPHLGDAANWEPLNAARWAVVDDGGDLRYAISTTNYSELSGSRLGEYSLVKGRTYGDFVFSARVRSGEDFAVNANADYAVLFGGQDGDNYYYVMFNRTAANTQLFKVMGGIRQPALANGSYAIPDNEYHQIEVSRAGSLITVKADGALIMQADDASFGAGRVGIGAFNDAAWWDDVAIAAPATSFSTADAYLGDAKNWEPLNASRWSLTMDGGDLRYGISTTNYSELSGSRLGEYSLVKGRTYGDFTFSARVRSSEDFAANANADHAVVFGGQDGANYYYVMFNRTAASTQLFKVVGGVRQPALADGSYAIPDNEYHQIEVSRAGSLITVKADGLVVMQANDATFGAGRVGVGAFNDAAWWDDIAIAAPPTTTFSTLDAYLGDAANWEPLNASRWAVVEDAGDLRYGISTTHYSELSGSRLGEYSLVKARSYGDFTFSARVRSSEDFAANANGDHAVLFGGQDGDNYYYVMFNRTAANTQLFKVVGGVRQPALANGSYAIPDNEYHRIEVSRAGSLITVKADGAVIMQANDASFGAGRVGIGAFNDAAWWDDVAIAVPFSTLDPYLGYAANWEPLNASRWAVVDDGGDLRYAISTTHYSERAGSRLGEYSLVKGRTYGDFVFSARVRSSEDFAANANADHAVVFGLQDANNYYYVMLNRSAASTQLFKVVDGVRQPALANGSYAIPDNEYHQIEVSRAGSLIMVTADGALIMQADDASFGAGRLGIGAFNDAASWDDVAIAVPAATDTLPPSTPMNVAATALSLSEVAVSWSASTDDVGVAGYRVYRDAMLVASPAGTSATVTGLSGGTLYAFSVAALDAAGNASAQSAPVLVTTPLPVTPPPTISFSALPATITAGQSVTMTWSSTNATSCTASDGWSGILATSGTQALAPSATSTYILTCIGIGGVASRSVLVTVASPVPTVSLSASPASINAGGSSTLSWSSTNAGSCTASGGWSGAKATAGSQAVSPSSTTAYGLSCTGSGGTASQNVTVTVAAPSAISASLVPSRTSGVAPLYVFFDATGTTAPTTSRPFHELEYQWNFGDAASGSWAATPGMPTSSRNLATGPVAAHVYETPGTYTVSLSVLDGGAAATRSVQITVTDPDTVFAANTLCVGNAQPVAGSGGCPAGAAVLQSSDFDAAINNNIASRKRILLQRGDSFAASSSANIRVNGPGLIGAFGTGAAPVVNITANNNAFQLSSGTTPTIRDWRIMDLEINGNSGAATNAIHAEGGIDQVTLLRMNIHHMHKGAQLAPNFLDSHGPEHRLWDQWAVVDSTIRNAIGGGGGYVLYFAGQRIAVMGNVLSDASAAEHILRTPYVYKGVISHNDMSRPAASKHVVKMQAASWFAAAPTAYTEQVLFSNNKFTSGDGGAWTVTFGPMDNQNDERVKQLIIERNWFAPHPGQQVALMVWAQDVTVRNNIFNLTGASGQTAITVEQRGVEPLPVNVHVYNNTFFSNSSGSFRPIHFAEGAGGMVAKNNLGYAPFSTSRDMISGVASVANNSSDTDILLTPTFTGAALLAPADFRLGSGSYALNAGTAVPVFSDFFRLDRPASGAMDLGAVERP